MQRLWASLGSLLFFVIAPGTVAGLVPWWITRWHTLAPFAGIKATRWLGVALIAVGLVPLIDSFARFAWTGLGTPAPIAPPTKLVVSGYYRRVRNPMYVALLAILAGEALLLADVRVLVCAFFVFAGAHLFVMFYEEPILRRKFGGPYEIYCANVPRWLPRLRAWRAR